MADPVIIPCASGVWTKVAINVTAGQVHKLGTKKLTYLSTYRDTGNAAPTLITEGGVVL